MASCAPLSPSAIELASALRRLDSFLAAPPEDSRQALQSFPHDPRLAWRAVFCCACTHMQFLHPIHFLRQLHSMQHDPLHLHFGEGDAFSQLLFSHSCISLPRLPRGSPAHLCHYVCIDAATGHPIIPQLGDAGFQPSWIETVSNGPGLFFSFPPSSNPGNGNPHLSSPFPMLGQMFQRLLGQAPEAKPCQTIQ